MLTKVESQPEAVAKIKAAERAWVAYRDAYIEATYPAKDKATEYGSMYPLEVALLRAKLTQRQVSALEDMLQHYTPK
ncbi:MAG: lysozyme inhibitor LprI family protein [Candidatus Acidiferrales bacterium]